MRGGIEAKWLGRGNILSKAFALLLSLTLINSAFADSGRHDQNSSAVGMSHLFVVDANRPFDALRASVVGSGSAFCKAADPDCLIHGKRTMVGQIFYPIKDKSVSEAKPARYCDLIFGRTLNQNECSTNTVEYTGWLHTMDYTLADADNNPENGNLLCGNLKPGLACLSDGGTVDANAAYQERYNRLIANTSLFDIKMAPVDCSANGCPVVIIRHGNYAGHHEVAEIGRRIAASGYIAVALDRTGGAGRSQVGKAPTFAVDNPNVVLSQLGGDSFGCI